jgi:hypothetical protein
MLCLIFDLDGTLLDGDGVIKQVGDTPILERHKSTCHCGAVELELHLPEGLVDLRRCNCSICRRKGAIMASVLLAGLRVAKGQGVLKLYQFNTRTAKHWFCSICGIYTHHQQRSDPTKYGFNVGCLEGVDPSVLGPIQTTDGVNHPSDAR